MLLKPCKTRNYLREVNQQLYHDSDETRVQASAGVVVPMPMALLMPETSGTRRTLCQCRVFKRALKPQPSLPFLFLDVCCVRYGGGPQIFGYLIRQFT
jgi:hypothetical protein